MTPEGACAVLFVDDDPRVLQGLRRMLHAERRVWTLRFAGSGREALACLDRESIDAVVTDWRMPDMDGADLLARVMERHPRVARIVLSGEIDPAAGYRAVRCAHQYLAKPCDAGALKAALARAFALRRLVGDRRLQGLLSRIGALPSPPALYAQVLAEIESPNSSSRTVGALIARDAGMTAKVLQLVNSSFFGLARRIGSPQEAVSLLGHETVRALVLVAGIFAQFEAQRMNELGLESLRRHCLATGRCARAISGAEALAAKARDDAFSAGLLHDVGKLVLAQNFPARYAEVLRGAQAPGRRLWELEVDCFGASHAELGGYLMGLWGLSEDVVESIAYHHRPPAEKPAGQLTALVYAANLLEHRLSAGPAAALPGADSRVLAQLGIAERFAAWEQHCRPACEEESADAA
jgi:HD-like signal output (HDOD) protein/CheY-like chemotaxis protein